MCIVHGGSHGFPRGAGILFLFGVLCESGKNFKFKMFKYLLWVFPYIYIFTYYIHIILMWEG